MGFAPSENKVTALSPPPEIIARGEHNISRGSISGNALKVLYRLRNAGYAAYLVGGSVRDLLLGREPKDFDIATDARPEQVRELFRNCRLIGRRFRLAHVHFGSEIIEVSTFRAPHFQDDLQASTEDGRILRDNVYGTIGEDVWRRDFTANALYYNIEDFSVVDYVGGVADIRAGLIRLIGQPELRFREDPVRLLRAVRFAAKLGFRLHPDTVQPMRELAPLLEAIPAARLLEETLKLFMGGCALQTYEQLRHHDLFGALFPQTEAVLAREENGFPQVLLAKALADTDRRLAEGKTVTPGFLIAALLWSPVHAAMGDFLARGINETEALSLAADAVVSRQISRVALPRRFTQIAREIWQLQPRFERTQGKRAQRFLEHPRFRAAWDFLLLRAEAGENVGAQVEWWTQFIARAGGPVEAGDHAETEESPAPRRRRRRRGGRGGRRGGKS
jgi:poly(A) polymerase